jgi:hypothetical protein
MAVFAVYIPYSEINGGVPSTLAEFHQSIETFPRSRILHFCTAMNYLLRSDDEPVNGLAHDSLVRTLFKPDDASNLLQQREEVRYAFHREQILFVAKTAIMQCADREEVIPTERLQELGRIFLMASDHLPQMSPKPEPLDERFAWFTRQLLPVQEASGFHRFDYKMARSYVMLSESITQLQGANRRYWDIPALFEQATGLPLLTFQSLLWGALTKFRTFDPSKYAIDPRSYSLNQQWFASTTVPPELVDRFLSSVSGTSDQFKAAFERTNWGNSDFTHFRDKPLFRDGENYFLIDFAFLAEKLETSPFWTVHNSLPSAAQKTDLHAFWGDVFEQYGRSLLRSTCRPPKNVFHDRPVFVDRDKGEACDTVVVCDTSAVFIEMKGATFSSRAKYGEDHQRLRTEIDNKLVQQEDGEAKAVWQLKRTIELAFDNQVPERIEGLDLRLIDTVFPLVITRDDIGSAFALNGYLQLKFSDVIQADNISVKVTPIFCMSAEDFERLSAYVKDVPLTDLLHAHYRACREKGDYLLTSYFATSGNELITRLGQRRSDLNASALRRLTESTIEHLGLRP